LRLYLALKSRVLNASKVTTYETGLEWPLGLVLMETATLISFLTTGGIADRRRGLAGIGRNAARLSAWPRLAGSNEAREALTLLIGYCLGVLDRMLPRFCRKQQLGIL